MGHTAAIPTVSQVEPAMGHTAAIPTVSQVEPAMGHTAAIPTVSQVEPAMGHTAAIPTVSQVEPAMGHTAAIPTVSQVEPAMGHTVAIPTVSQVEPAMGHTAAIPTVSLQRCCWGAGISLLTDCRGINPFLFSVSEGHPQAVLTLQSAWSQIFTGETVTLSCEVEGASADWRFKQYRDGREDAGCSDQYSRRDGNSCTISYSQHYHSGVYWCESASGQERSNAVTLTVSNGRVILQTPPQPVIEGDTLTLRCRVWSYTATRVVFYKDNKQLQSRAGTELSVDHVSKSDEGSYRCRAWWWNTASRTEPWSESAEVRVSVRADTPEPVLAREPAGEIFEGDTVTLSCVVEGGSGGWRYLWYKDRQGAPVYQTDSSSGTGAEYTISAAALSHSGEYWCGAGRGRNTSYSQYSHPIWVNVTALFSRVTLTASPGATVKEGEALNLTCEAAVNKTPRPELHYTIVRDGEPVTNSTDSALYSIASTEKSHTGSYTCAVESQGVKKSSQELHIEVQTTCHTWCLRGMDPAALSAILEALDSRREAEERRREERKTSDQDQEQSAEEIELSSRVQHTGVELE
ncbi:UNVERIFIED_CONTAM: hypothetical protein FKN15_072834 [Acipenser sinensis]